MACTAVVTFIDHRINAMLDCPEAWGGHLEVELQVLLALEVRAVAQEREHQAAGVHDRFLLHLNAVFGDSALPLAHRAALGHRLDLFVSTLRAFVERERA